jgi:hypothetical protein
MTDPNVLHPDHAPTPFTADEIRSATPAGYTVETITEQAGVVSRRRTEFADVEADRATMVMTPIDEHGEPVGVAREVAVTWTDLQAHASFPAAITTVSRETIETPLGSVNCLRYDVSSDDHTNTFWFSPMHPGMPIRVTSDASNAPTTTVVSIARPA